MKILVLDNYDSFTYNLVHYIQELTDVYPDVARNDEIGIQEIQNYSHILLSPGPGVPDEAGILKEVIQTYGSVKSIFGVCLGMQAIGEVYGGELKNLSKVFHGLATPLKITDFQEPTFMGVPDGIQVGRYHSWVVSEKNFPDKLKITAIDQSGQIMALRHKEFNVRGVQFHPESVLTEYGKQMLNNWITFQS